MIISIGRQTGAGGLEVSHRLARELNFGYLDKNRLLKKADELGFFEQMLQFYDEAPVNSLLQAISHNEFVGYNKQKEVADIYKKLALSGDYVVVGRCANYFLRNFDCCFSVFLHADLDFKAKRVMQLENLSQTKALEHMETSDEGRASFHKYYTHETWGGSAHYDLCICTSSIGIDSCVELIKYYHQNIKHASK